MPNGAVKEKLANSSGKKGQALSGESIRERMKSRIYEKGQHPTNGIKKKPLSPDDPVVRLVNRYR